MAALNTNTAPVSAIVTYRIVRFLSNVAASILEWNDARVTRNALSKLSNRELDDIGLSRADIAHIGSLERL